MAPASADCKAAASKATAGCRGNVAKMKATATKTCNGRDYEKIMARVNRLKRLAERQEAALKRGASALAKVRANAARIAKLSGKERAKLLKELAIQKKDKSKLAKAQELSQKEQAKLGTLRQQADAALAKAVQIQRTTGNKSEVLRYKGQAHSLYHKMVDENALKNKKNGAEKDIGTARRTEAGAKRVEQAAENATKVVD